MENQYTGEVRLKIGKDELTIIYDWRALGNLKSLYTEKDLDDVVNGRNLDVIADVLAIGLKKHHPEMTAEKIMDISPPFTPTVEAVGRALTLAYFGPEEQKAAKVQSKKKTKASGR